MYTYVYSKASKTTFYPLPTRELRYHIHLLLPLRGCDTSHSFFFNLQATISVLVGESQVNNRTVPAMFRQTSTSLNQCSGL